MDAVEATIVGGVFSGVLALFKVIERQLDRKVANGNITSDAAIKKAIYNTERNSDQCVKISAKQTEILRDMKTTLAIMAERDCPIGRRNSG